MIAVRVARPHFCQPLGTRPGLSPRGKTMMKRLIPSLIAIWTSALIAASRWIQALLSGHILIAVVVAAICAVIANWLPSPLQSSPAVPPESPAQGDSLDDQLQSTPDPLHRPYY